MGEMGRRNGVASQLRTLKVFTHSLPLSRPLVLPIYVAAAQHARASAHDRASCALRVSASDDRADKRGGRRLGDSRRRGTAAGNSQSPGQRRIQLLAEERTESDAVAAAAHNCTLARERCKVQSSRCRRSSAARTQTRLPIPPVQSQSISST